MEGVQQTQEKGTYLYAVVPASVASQLKDVNGVENAKVSTIVNGELAAVYSELPTREELRPERRLLAAHQGVLKKVTDLSPVVLPVSFGTIAESPEGVSGLLERYQQEFSKQMKRVEGKLEMGVRLSYATEKPSIYEFLVASSPELRDMRDRIAQAGREATREEKIDLGQKFEAVLSSLRDEYAEKLEQPLKKIGDVRRNPPRNEKEFVNIACLVPKENQRDFEAAVEEAAGLFPDSFIVQPYGPFPPYDFVELHLKSAAS